MKSIFATCCLLLVAGVAVFAMTAAQPPSTASAEAVEQPRSVQALSYTKLITVEGNPKPLKAKELFAEDGRHRTELESGVTTVFDTSSMLRLTLIETGKKALVCRPVVGNQEGPNQHFMKWLEMLKKLGDEPDRKLGEKAVEGRRAVGFVATLADSTYTIWVDAETNQLIRVEYDMPAKGPVKHIVMTGFKFNQRVDESLFSFDVPDGYTVHNQPPPPPRVCLATEKLTEALRRHGVRKQAVPPKVSVGEENVVEALRGYTKLADGRFPASISKWDEWAVLFTKNSDNGRITAEAKLVSGHLGSIHAFLYQMPKDSYKYIGKGKTLADTDAVVFWHKTRDGAYRAVYGDLTVKAIAADDLPK